MKLHLDPEPAPLRLDADGVCRVSGTRATLESLITSFQQGTTAEEIADQYPSVPLADIYATITYYLRHRDEVEAYLQNVEAREADVIREIESCGSPFTAPPPAPRCSPGLRRGPPVERWRWGREPRGSVH